MRNRWLSIICLTLGWAIFSVPICAAQTGKAALASGAADLVIVDGRLASPGPLPHRALAIRGDRIIAVGTQEEIERFIGPQTRRLNAGGKTVTAGINDAHVHFLSGSLSLDQVDLSETETLADVESRIVPYAQSHSDKACIVGRGWVYGAFPGGLPTKEQLDRWIPDRPAIMRCYDGHTVWANSKALAAAGITRLTEDPVGGIIDRDPATGEPTGVLKESAQDLVDKIIPDPSREEKLNALRKGIANAHRYGVTSVQEAGVGLEELELFEALRNENELPLRMAIGLRVRPRFTEADADQLDGLKKRFRELKIGAVKLYVDGVIESHTAALLSPYADRPTLGLPETSQEDLDRMVAMLDRRGWQIMIHAIGDGGIRMCLDAFERAQKANDDTAGDHQRRHRLEHIESISREDIGRIGKLGVLASMQPYHANPNSNVFNVWAVNLGPERASRAWIWKSIEDAGGRLAFGSDWPVVSIDPRRGMHTALTRQTLKGEPAKGFLPEQRLTLERIIEAYTRGAAYAEFSEKEKGMLQVGMLADIVVWDEDLYSLPVERVHQANVRYTVFDGKVVYQK